MTNLLNRFMSWMRAGYAMDVPLTDQVPLVALLTREISPVESRLVAAGQVAE